MKRASFILVPVLLVLGAAGCPGPKEDPGGSGNQGGTTCTAVGDACAADDDCCGGAVCAHEASGNVCRSVCNAQSDCDTGCCLALAGTTAKVCTPSGVCDGCLTAGTACDGSGDCCQGTLCVDDPASGPVCAAFCTSGSDCSSGCCVGLASRPESVCVDASNCQAQCAEVLDFCGTGEPPCCSGLVCVDFQKDGVRCARTCSAGSDCVGSGCCVGLADGTTNVCAPTDDLCGGGGGNACDDCIHACQGTPGCCTGTGCICCDVCMPGYC